MGPPSCTTAAAAPGGNRGTHADTMRGIQALREEGLPFSVISVLTRESLRHADALVDFYLENGIQEVGFNMEETEGRA